MKLKIVEAKDPKRGIVYNIVSYETKLGFHINQKFVAGSWGKRSDAEKELKAKENVLR